MFNTDQGVQFTSASFTSRLESAGAEVSMDGKGRCLDNVFVERLWRTVKYEYVYLWRPEAVPALQTGLAHTSATTTGRSHQSLANRTPAEVYGTGLKGKARRDEVRFRRHGSGIRWWEEAPDRRDQGPDAIGVPSAELSLGWMLASRANLRFTRREGDTASASGSKSNQELPVRKAGKSVAKEGRFLSKQWGPLQGEGPFVIKDHIKSAKHLWHEACFVPKGSAGKTLSGLRRT